MPLQHNYVPIMVTLHSVKYIGIVAKWIHTYKCYVDLSYMYGSSGRAAELMWLPHYYEHHRVHRTGCPSHHAHIILY